MKKIKKIFIAVDTNKISKAKRIIRDTKTNKRHAWSRKDGA